MNAGLAEARGRYFRVVDGDDWVNTDGMAELLERLADLDCDLVVDKKREIDMTSGEGLPFPLAKGVVTGRVLDFSSVLTNGDTVFQIMIHTLTARTDYLRGIGIHLLEHTFYETTSTWSRQVCPPPPSATSISRCTSTWWATRTSP